MVKDFRSIDIEIIKDFIEGEEHDIYLLVKKTCFKDMYMSLYEYSFRDLKDEDNIETFIDTAFKAYRKQNKLNQSLKISSGKYFDDFLISCVVGEIYQRYPNSDALKNVSKEEFKNKIIEKEKTYLDNILINEYNIDFLTSLLKDKFSDSTTNIKDVIDYIYEISNKDNRLNIINDYFDYINELIVASNLTLNQLGNESLIKKNIYDITLDKLPTKNNLIMLSFALRLSKEKRLKLFELASSKVKDKSNSNMYSFDMNNKRDKLIMHWLNNIDELDLICKKKNKYIVSVVNDILESANFDILK